MPDFFAKYSISEDMFSSLLAYGANLIGAVLILLIGLAIARWARRRLNRPGFGGKHIDPTLKPVFAGTVFYLIVGFALYAFLTRLGVPATSLLAVFGAAGLAIGLALKDTLANIAAGVMLLILRPLKIGEFVIAPGFSGTVVEIGLFVTTVKTLEGLYTYVPNSQVWGHHMTNLGRHNVRKLSCDIGVGYDTDLKKAQTLLLKTMTGKAVVLDKPTSPEVYVMEFADSAIILSCRCWLPAENWLGNTSDIRISLKAALDKAGIDIPFPQQVVTHVNK